MRISLWHGTEVQPVLLITFNLVAQGSNYKGDPTKKKNKDAYVAEGIQRPDSDG